MKSTVDAKAFSAALKKVSGLLKPSAIPQLAEVHAAFTGKTCRLTASDLTAWFSIEIPAEGDAFELVFSNTKAVARASTHFSRRMTLELNDADKTLTISCSAKSGEFSTLDTDLFPGTPSFEPTERYPIRVDELYERIKRISYASRIIEKHPIAAGVRFQGDNLWCIDGNRIAVQESSSLTVKEPFILKAESLAYLRDFNKCRGEMAVGSDYVAFKSRNLLLTIRRMKESDGLQIERFIHKDATESYLVDCKTYMDAINYLRDCGGATGHAKLVFDAGDLVLEGKNGKYRAAVIRNADCKVAYACELSHLREALRQFDGRRQVQISTVSSKDPIVLTDSCGGTALIMPLELNREETSKAA